MAFVRVFIDRMSQPTDNSAMTDLRITCVMWQKRPSPGAAGCCLRWSRRH